MIVDEVKKIREIESLKEKEIKEAQRQASQVILEVEKEIEQNRAQALEDAERQAEVNRNQLIEKAQAEVKEILNRYQEETEDLKSKMEQRIPNVVHFLVEKVWQEYGD